VAEQKGCPAIEKFDAHEVTFASGKAVLTAAGKKELDIVVNYLASNSKVNVKLDGYTDNSGTDKVNNPLSEKRAEAAKAYLVSKGVDAGRILTEGHGSSNPVADNNTKAGKAKNRRVEVTVQ
jgi:outer membrane protein OmpA-like peptidoglycan-associated protein